MGYQYQNASVANRDVVVGVYVLGNAQYSPLQQSVTSLTDANGVKYNVFSSSSITVDNVFTLRFSIADRDTIIGSGMRLGANYMKMDMEVQYFGNSNFNGPILDTSNTSACQLISTGPSTVASSRGATAAAAANAGIYAALINTILC